MGTALYSHPAAAGHLMPPGHPEQVARHAAVMAALDRPAFAALDRREAPEAGDDLLTLCHPQAYVDRVAAAVPEAGFAALDGDTHIMAGSLQAARRGVGAAVAAVDAVMAGEVTNAFSAMRPPGHHAERATAMGFCVFGTIAIAARHAMVAHGLTRVAVVDFDVHHGNGTQDLLWDEAGALFVSTHQSPLYPGTGATTERGAHGQVLNLPLPPYTDGARYGEVFDARVMPALEAHRPELILVSAGFDAHRADPLAQMMLDAEDFGWIGSRLTAAAQAQCGGRLVSVLEGGYDLPALGASAAAWVSALMDAGERGQG